MPVYEYKCEQCGHEFEKIIYKKDEEIRCPKCDGEVKKIMSTPQEPIVF